MIYEKWCNFSYDYEFELFRIIIWVNSNGLPQYRHPDVANRWPWQERGLGKRVECSSTWTNCIQNTPTEHRPSINVWDWIMSTEETDISTGEAAGHRKGALQTVNVVVEETREWPIVRSIRPSENGIERVKSEIYFTIYLGRYTCYHRKYFLKLSKFNFFVIDRLFYYYSV